MSPAALSYIARHARGPLMRSQPDQRLVALVRSGSEPAFEALVARYRDPLLRYCRRILSADRAEDAVQQTFVNAHAAIEAGRAGDDLRPWLYRIAHNAAIDQLRQRRGPEEQLTEELAGGEAPEDVFSRRERLADIVTAIEDLPPRQRDALLLRELEGRSYDEIAFALGVGDGAVRQLLNRARNTMRSAAAALVPPAVLRWSPDQLGRGAEVAGGAGATTVVAKTWLGGLLAAASLGGVVAVPLATHHVHRGGRPAPAQPREASRGTVSPPGQQAAAVPVVAQVAARHEAPQPGEAGRSGRAPAAHTVTGESERPSSRDLRSHPREHAGGGGPQGEPGDGSQPNHGDDKTGSSGDGGSDGAPQPPDNSADHGSDTGDPSPPETETPDPPEPASVDEPPGN